MMKIACQMATSKVMLCSGVNQRTSSCQFWFFVKMDICCLASARCSKQSTTTSTIQVWNFVGFPRPNEWYYLNRMLLRGNNHINNNSYQERVRFNNNNNHYILWGRSVLERCVFTKEKRHLLKFLGGDCSELPQVTFYSQLSRPITLRRYTSWNTDCAGDNTLCNETLLHRCILPVGPRSWCRRVGDPRAHDDDQIM